MTLDDGGRGTRGRGAGEVLRSLDMGRYSDCQVQLFVDTVYILRFAYGYARHSSRAAAGIVVRVTADTLRRA